MFNTQKQIDYWKNGAISDIETAEILLNKNKLKECLFFCHLTIEKILKAHYSKIFTKVPPKTHSLNYFVEKLDLSINENVSDLFGILMNYQLEGRYPDYEPEKIGSSEVLELCNNTKEVLLWLIQML
ncbi:MAG: HEPN domain-containing protein [Ignavibacteriae bacterium]|nr:HEPN domain-containing protein [Ignavibacteriota bacterium]